MPPTITYTDPAKALRDYFRDNAAYLVVDSDRIGLGTVTGDGSQIVVFRVGGGDDSSEAPLDRALLQIDVWHGTSYNACSNVVNKIRALLRELRGANLNASTRGYGAEVLSEIFLPDRETNAVRFALTVELTVRAI